MALSKEILEALKDPETLKQIREMDRDPELEELFGNIEFSDDATPAEIAKAINERSKKQMQYISKISEKSEKAAKKILEEEKIAKSDAEVSSFLKAHPELVSNEELLDIVEPLYKKYGDIQRAYDLGVKALGIEAKKEENTPPIEEERKEQTPKSQLKSDDPKLSDDPAKEGIEPAKPKTLREILSETSNKLTASGNNPYKEK